MKKCGSCTFYLTDKCVNYGFVDRLSTACEQYVLEHKKKKYIDFYGMPEKFQGKVKPKDVLDKSVYICRHLGCTYTDIQDWNKEQINREFNELWEKNK